MDFAANNPFLDLLEGFGQNMQQEQQHQQRQAPAQPRYNFKLPDFWPHAPAMWFARAQFRMEVAGIATERDMFAYTVDALPYESLRLVNDLLMAPPAERPFSLLKERLLLATQLTPVQMADRLMKMPELGDRRPSQMLAAMLEFCPPGEEGTAFFRAAYLSRLPADIRGHLDGLETGDLKELAARADRQWANGRGAIAPVAAVDSLGEAASGDEMAEPVAAVGQGGRSGWKGKKKFQQKNAHNSGGGSGSATGGFKGSGSGGASKKQGDWSKLSQVAICQRHLKFGNDVFACVDPSSCQWSRMGN